MNNNFIKIKGHVNGLIEYRNGEIKKFDFPNTVLRTGKNVLAKCLTNSVNDPFDFFVERMIFGTNGTSGDTPRFVDDSRNGLFGPVLLSKSVISDVDESSVGTSIFTAVVTFDEGVGNNLNEMALQLDNGDLFSMVTFPDLGKTSDMQLTWNWTISFL